MAIARCEICGPPRGKKYDYTHAHTLLSSPSSNMVCAGAGMRSASIDHLADRTVTAGNAPEAWAESTSPPKVSTTSN